MKESYPSNQKFKSLRCIWRAHLIRFRCLFSSPWSQGHKMELIFIFYISLCFPNIVYSLDVQYIRNNNNNNSVVITGSKFQNRISLHKSASLRARELVIFNNIHVWIHDAILKLKLSKYNQIYIGERFCV
jgi:hypothetical protein